MKQKLCFGGGFPTLLLCNGVESTGKTCDAPGEFSGQHCIESVLAGDLDISVTVSAVRALPSEKPAFTLKVSLVSAYFAKHSGCGDFIILTCGDGGGSSRTSSSPVIPAPSRAKRR